MTIAKTIPKPRNWQDFEKLCKKLFGEIWECPTTIKANGRSGQSQAGVDIYGVPKTAKNYWGVQCKGKDDYLGKTLTTDEIDAEIESAHGFKPPLDVFVIATTASKDSKIEAHVREKDIKSRKAGKFSIVLYCWEDLADLIEENKATFNWWVREKRHKELFGIDVAFDNGAKEITIYPKFKRVITEYVLSSVMISTPSYTRALSMTSMGIGSKGLADFYRQSSAANLSWVKIPISFENAGQEVIEDYKIAFELDGEFSQIGDQGLFSVISMKESSFHVWDDGSFRYQPYDKRPLTQGDSRHLNLDLKPLAQEYDLRINWKLYARDFRDEGSLLVHVSPEYVDEFDTKIVGDEASVRRAVKVEDYIDDE